VSASVRKRTYVRLPGGADGEGQKAARGAPVFGAPPCVPYRPVGCWRRLGRVAPASLLCCGLGTCQSGAPSRRQGSVAPHTTTQELSVASDGYLLVTARWLCRVEEDNACVASALLSERRPPPPTTPTQTGDPADGDTADAPFAPPSAPVVVATSASNVTGAAEPPNTSAHRGSRQAHGSLPRGNAVSAAASSTRGGVFRRLVHERRRGQTDRDTWDIRVRADQLPSSGTRDWPQLFEVVTPLGHPTSMMHGTHATAHLEPASTSRVAQSASSLSHRFRGFPDGVDS